jgi:DNA polymerase III sliding clamp (beta) subunit (PCNA family)
VLTGILVSASGDELRMVATDSYRLSVKETKLEAPLSGAFEANVPARALQELTRIVQHESADELGVSVRANVHALALRKLSPHEPWAGESPAIRRCFASWTQVDI